MAFLGNENGKILCFHLVWVFGIQFALRTGQEHRNLELFGLVRFTNLQSMEYLNGLSLNYLPWKKKKITKAWLF